MASDIFRNFLLSRVGAEAWIGAFERPFGRDTGTRLLQQADRKNYFECHFGTSEATRTLLFGGGIWMEGNND